MGEKSPPAKKSELEQKYEEALETIAGGKSWETIVAKSALNKKSRGIDRFLAYLKDNLAAIASLAVAISGISFGILQYKTGQWQKEREITIAKVEALEKLLPSLTSENANARRYALSALFTLYSDDSASTDNKEFLALLEQIGEVGDAETVDAIARKLKHNVNLRKRAAELYAIRAEQNRHNAADAEQPSVDKVQQNFYKARQYNDAAWEDTQRALAIDPDNAKALYQLGRLLMDTRRDFSGASEKFSQVIKLIDDKKYPLDTEIYVGSYLNKLRCLYLPDKKITPAVCEAYKVTAAKYREYGVGELDTKGENLEELESGCP